MSIVRAAAVLAVVGWAAALSAMDLKHRRLPNVLTLSGAGLIMSVAAAAGRGAPALLGAVALSGPYLVVYLANPRALGGGDVKLAVALGALTGALGGPVWMLAALGAPILTVVAATVSALRRRGTVVPHGPSMCLASLLAAALAVF